MVDFSSSYLKIDRATEHLDCFDHEWGVWLEAHPIKIVPKPYVDPLRKLFCIEMDAVPEHLALIMGDCMHNLRTALDHAAVALAKAHSPKGDVYKTSFPLADCPLAFFGKDANDVPNVTPSFLWPDESRHIALLSDEAKSVIWQLQPYYGDSHTTDLIKVQYLDNRDKHRAVLITGAAPGIEFDAGSGANVTYASPIVLKDGAHYATVKLVSPTDEVKVKRGFISEVGVEASGTGDFLMSVVIRSKIIPDVRWIIDTLKSNFG